jgi:hypothetical protein
MLDVAKMPGDVPQGFFPHPVARYDPGRIRARFGMWRRARTGKGGRAAENLCYEAAGASQLTRN